MLVILVMLALAACAGALLFSASGYATAVPVHLALAGGAMPLIAGAMLHFVPVLTRSAAPGRHLAALPWLMAAAGLLVFGSFLFAPAALALRDAAAALAIIVAATLAGVIVRLARRTLGGAHPGVYWYLAALLCLLLGLTTVLLMHIWPEHYAALRRFHLHLNTLGFIGITAIGTLQVLLPTALAQPDPHAGRRLRNDLKWVVAGTLLIASGAAWQRALVWPGVVLWLLPLLRLAAAWMALYRQQPRQWNSVATAIAGALLGYVVTLAFGSLHASGLLPARHAGLSYLFAFLLPLVTGAASYLLPLWVRPGMQSDWHQQARQTLARFSALRVLLFIAAGAVAAWSGSEWGWLAAVIGLGLFSAQLRVLAAP